MNRIFHILLFAMLLCSCGGPSYEEGVRARIKSSLGIEALPDGLVIGASTIDFGDDWPTYQFELTMPPEVFDSIVRKHDYEQVKFTEPRSPYQQHIVLAKPFSAVGEYHRIVAGTGVCHLFYEADAGRYFLLFMERGTVK